MSELNMKNENYTSKLLDPTGIAISLGCLIHCLLLPTLLPFLPMAENLGGEQVHKTLVASLLVITGISLFRGYITHRNLNIPILGFVGLTFLVFATMLPEELSSQILVFHLSVESTLTAIGGAILIMAHIRNYNLCRCKDLIQNDSCALKQS